MNDLTESFAVERRMVSSSKRRKRFVGEYNLKVLIQREVVIGHCVEHLVEDCVLEGAAGCPAMVKVIK